MEKLKYILKNFLSVILIIGFIFIPIAGSLLHIYTAYLLSITNGFFGAFLGFCFPIISEIWCLIDRIIIYGFSDHYVYMVFFYLLGFVITVISNIIIEKDK